MIIIYNLSVDNKKIPNAKQLLLARIRLNDLLYKVFLFPSKSPVGGVYRLHIFVKCVDLIPPTEITVT